MTNRFIQRFSPLLVAFACGGILAQAAAPANPQGAITAKAFFDIGGGTAVADLTGNAKFPNSPDQVTYPTCFELHATGSIDTPPPADVFNNYGAQILGYFYPPSNGDYIFYLSSDDGGQLWLSTDADPANKKLIAQETGWSGVRSYTAVGAGTVEAKDSSQFTGTEWPTKDPVYGGAKITLVANRPYYIEALMKEGGGGDNLSVAVLDPNYAMDATKPIPGQYLSSFDKASGPVTFTVQPQSQTVHEGDGVTFTVSVDGTPPYTYQWKRDGADLPGATSPSYTLARTAGNDDGARFTCAVSNPVGTVASQEAALTVITDTAPPVLQYATGSSEFNRVRVWFSEPMDPATAQVAANYRLSGGVTVSSATLQAMPNDHLVVLATSAQPVGTVLTLTVNNVKDLAGNTVAADSQVEFQTFVLATGLATYQRWHDENGDVGTVNAAAPDPLADAIAAGTIRAPDFEGVVTQFGGPWGVRDNYKARVMAYFLPPATGNYVFFVGSDDRSLVYLSTDDKPANKKLIARETQWSNQYQFTATGGGSDLTQKRSDQNWETEWPTSSTVTLTQGRQYYLEVLWAEGGGGDGADVTYIREGNADPANNAEGMLLKGEVIATYVDPNVDLAIVRQPTDQVGVLPSTGIEIFARDFNANDGGFTVVNTDPAPPGPWEYDAAAGQWVAQGSVPECGGPYNSKLNSPAYKLTQDGAVSLSFDHRYSFEGDLWDAGQVWISVNGSPATLVPAENFTANGYAEGNIVGAGIANGKRAFNGDSPGYAAGTFITSKAFLGNFKKDDTLVVQFAGIWDECATGTNPNWVLDSMKLDLLPMIIQDFSQNDGGFTVENTDPAPPGPWIYSAANGQWAAEGSVDECGGPYNSKLISPAYTVPQTDAVTLSFTHRYSFEGDLWDGGQVRLSVNGGPFTPVAAESFTANGYAEGLIQGSGILNGQRAFNGDSPGYATGALITSTVVLGQFNQNDTLRVQFVGGWDECATGSHPSWVVKSLQLVFGQPAQAATFDAEVRATLQGQPVPIAYQWQRDDGAGWVDIPGETRPAFRIFPVAADFDARFRLMVASPPKSLTSNIVRLILGEVEPPEISLSRSGGTITINYSGTLQSAASVNGPWQDVAGAQSPYTVPGTGAAAFYRSMK